MNEDIPPELDETIRRLENWGRWAYERSSPGRAASAEGKYRPRWGNNESEQDALDRARSGSNPAIDALDALLVGKALAPAGGFPLRWFIIIKFKFLVRAHHYLICRKAAISLSSYQSELRQALFGARNALTKRKI